ncbi:unnamed protein product [Polarella glacialis]|uniref:Uncharacterized protein n=1 Tax=Polarella glacialis TaxID=89957 RepID=A0A813HJH5_POLGL|nr:unnamed protein product [Polarella glacialis]
MAAHAASLLATLQALHETCFGGSVHTADDCCDLRFGARGKTSCWKTWESEGGFYENGYEVCCIEPLRRLALACHDCIWVNFEHCLNHKHFVGSERDHRLNLSMSGFAVEDQCFDLCCGSSISDRMHRVSMFNLQERQSQLLHAPVKREGLDSVSGSSAGTSRRCHLHTDTSPFCEYNQLCVAEETANLALVFLRKGEPAEAPWLPLHVFPTQRYPGLLLDGQDVGSVVLPHGFWWPPLPDSPDEHQVGWSQPQSDSPEQKIVWDRYTEGVGEPMAALILGLDPSFGPVHMFRYAQLVLPAFAARVRLAWADGTGVGPLGPLPRLDPVVLADPLGASSQPWQRGLLDLVTGGSVTIMQARDVADTGAPTHLQSSNLRCFHRAVVVGQGLRHHSTTGSIDHAALLLEVAWQVPSVRLVSGGVILASRRMPPATDTHGDGGGGGGGDRQINERELVTAMRQAIRKVTGYRICGIASPCVLKNRGNETFADTVRIFAKSSMLVGQALPGLANMLFMPPASVVMVLQAIGTPAEPYSAMAVGCGHLPVVFFVKRVPCKHHMQAMCHVQVDIPSFQSTFEAAFSYAFTGL